MRYLKIFELFDAGNVYKYELIDTKKGKDDDCGDYDSYIYKFEGKSGDVYITTLNFFTDIAHYNNALDNFVTLDFQDEESYKQNSDSNIFDIEYKNLNIHDAVKIINTVFDILLDFMKNHDVHCISFNCTNDRARPYLYAIRKHLSNFIMIETHDDHKHYFYLYNSKDYYKEDGSIYRKGSDLCAY